MDIFTLNTNKYVRVYIEYKSLRFNINVSIVLLTNVKMIVIVLVNKTIIF